MLQGLGTLLGSFVRVQLKAVDWTQDVNEPNASLLNGGDPVTAPTTLFNKIYSANSSGNVMVNFHLQNLYGYEMIVTPSATTTTSRYEAETATLTDAIIYSATVDSAGKYVGAISNTDSAVTFSVSAPEAGLYDLAVRYAAANPSPDVQTITVNGIPQGILTYPQTAVAAGIAVSRTDKYVMLRTGVNTIRFGHSFGSVQLDCIDLSASGANGPQIYEAENALSTDVTPHTDAAEASNASNGAYIGGINNSDSTVSFTVMEPNAGTYDLLIAYGTTAAATHTLTINGVAETPVSYTSTGGYLNTSEGTVDVPVTLNAGVNKIVLGHQTGFAELDFIALSPLTAAYQIQYEAEAAVVTDAIIYSSSTFASGGAYVGGINNADSTVAFNVSVPTTGLYDMTVRYAADGTAATQTLIINGISQGSVSYPATSGWSNSDLLTTTQLVALQAGKNTITFGKGTAYAELDEISLQSDHHRYEAETATITDATAGHFPYSYTYPFADFVGSINNSDSQVSFNVSTPVAGVYLMQVAYGNGSGTTSSYTLSINGIAGSAITLPVNGGYLGSAGPAGESIVTVPVTLVGGQNIIVLSKGISYAELNDINLVYTGAPQVILSGPNEYLRLSSDGTTLDVWCDTAPNGSPAYTVPMSQLTKLTLTPTAAGAGTVTVDFSNGSPVPSGGLSVDGTTGATLPLILAIVGTSAADTITVNAATVMVGSVTITYAGVAAVSVNGNGGTDSITQASQPSNGNGQLLLSGSTASDHLTINGGTFVVPASAGGVLVYSLASLTIGGGGVLSMAFPTTAPADRTLLLVGNLSIGGTLDIGQNDIDVTAPSLPSLLTAVTSGYAHGTWTGTGLTSSAAAGDTRHLTAVALVQNSFDGSAIFSTFDGQAVGSANVLIRYTYYGDTNLDGHVDGTDYSRTDVGFLNHYTSWYNGDFDYDQQINGSDYTLMDNAFNTQSAGLAAQIASSIAATAKQEKVGTSAELAPRPRFADLFITIDATVMDLANLPEKRLLSNGLADVLDRLAANKPARAVIEILGD